MGTGIYEVLTHALQSLSFKEWNALLAGKDITLDKTFEFKLFDFLLSPRTNDTSRTYII